MRRAKLLQEIRKMRFEEAYEGWNEGRLTQEEPFRTTRGQALGYLRYPKRTDADSLCSLCCYTSASGVRNITRCTGNSVLVSTIDFQNLRLFGETRDVENCLHASCMGKFGLCSSRIG